MAAIHNPYVWMGCVLDVIRGQRFITPPYPSGPTQHNCSFRFLEVTNGTSIRERVRLEENQGEPFGTIRVIRLVTNWVTNLTNASALSGCPPKI